MIRWLWNNMMKWGWDFNRNLRDPDEPDHGSNPISKVSRARNSLYVSEDIEVEQGLNITVRNATGGRIVTFRQYDRKTDRHNHRLYIVPEDHDFEKELGKMITLESLRG